MQLERLLVIEDPEEQERFWCFYDEVFRPVNEETPIMQTFPEKDFKSFLVNPRVVKFAIREGSEIIALGLITDQVDLEPLISQAYFAKYHPGQPIYHIPALAVGPKHRKLGLAIQMIKAMINEIPDNGVLAFFYSKKINPLLPKFAELIGAIPVSKGREVDTEACCVFQWKEGQKIAL